MFSVVDRSTIQAHEACIGNDSMTMFFFLII